MLTFTVPGRGTYELQHLVLDINGTLAVDGYLVEGVADRLAQLQAWLTLHLLTADTHGRGAVLAEQLGLPMQKLTGPGEAEQKRAFVRHLGASAVVAIGNGANDAGMLDEAALGIAVLGGEGLAIAALEKADLVAAHPTEALDLLLHPKRLVASLRD